MDKQARTLSILGDSYSTFKGWLPEGNYIYYPNENVPDMTRAEDTWWQLLIAKRGFRMLINDSSSGTTVSTSVRPQHVISDAFVMRMKNSLSENGVNGEKPDCILLFGGTNDGWTDVKVGVNRYADWTDADLKQFLPAFCYMLDYVTGKNPQAQIAAIVNTDLADGMAEGMQQACEHYGVQCILLHDISKVCGHPDRQGMRQIAEQVDAALG
ncbi:MAG: hypothetical protein II481_02690 [Clostridia bacterium]|nr:hypothetical protein [Clostridia bacterium]